MGFAVSGRMTWSEAVSYWIAQFAGGIAGALLLWGIFSTSPLYSRSTVGLGTNGYGKQSMIHINLGGAILAEIVLTFLFVFVVLGVTSKLGSPGFAGLAIGLSLRRGPPGRHPADRHVGEPRPQPRAALVVGGTALKQVWVFIVAPPIGGALAALAYRYLFAEDDDTVPRSLRRPSSRSGLAAAASALRAGRAAGLPWTFAAPLAQW